MIINGRDTRKNSLSNTNTKDLSYYRNLKAKAKQQIQPTIPNVPKININDIAEQSRGGMTSAQIRQQANLMQQQKALEKQQEQERWNNLSLGEKIADPFKTAGANIKFGDLGIEENIAWNEYRSKQDEESLKKAQEATRAREEYQLNNDRIGKGNAVTKDFAQYLPQLGGQLKAGLGGAAAGAGTGALSGAGIALAAGQLGPQVAVPEEIATVPAGALTGAAWGGKGGYVTGTAKYGYDMMAGSAYKTLLDMGVPNDVALELSGDEALISSLIEGGGAIVDLITLGIGKLGSKGATTAGKELAKNRLLAAAKAYGVNLISEPIEEMAQEKVSIETEKKAADKTGIERTATDSEDWQRIKDAGETALKVAAVSGGLNAGGNYLYNTVGENLTTNKDTMKLKEIDSKTLSQLEDINSQKYQNVDTETNNLPKMDTATEKQLKLLKNVPQNDLQNVPNQQTNVILPTQTEIAQKGNMERITSTPNLPTQKAQETLQSAKLAGMTDMDIKKATDLNNMLRSGAELKFYDANNIPQNVQADKAKIANGFYKDGTLWINKNSKNAVEQILGHELTHHLESTNSYTDLSNTILDSEVFYDFIAEKGYTNLAEYKTKLKEMGYSDTQLDNEMVARFVEEKLFTDQKSIARLARQNTNLVEKIKNWISDLVVNFKGTSQEKELRRIENMYRKALEQARNTASSGGTQYSVGGVIGARNIQNNPEYRNIMTDYREANVMLKNGMKNSETIRKTGWFKDTDGNIKYEFSDEDMALKDSYKFETNKIYPLDNILKHDILFEAYPQLRDYTVVSMNLGDKHRAAIFGPMKVILLNNQLLKTKGQVEYSLIHEIQHAIQNIEGFPGARTNINGKYAYYTSLGEIESRDTSNRLRMLAEERKMNIPETAKENPTHPGLENYLKNRKEADIEKDNKYIAKKERTDALKEAVKKFIEGRMGFDDFEESDNSNIYKTTSEDDKLSSRTDGRGRLAGKEPAFSMPEIPKGYTRLYRGLTEEYNKNYDKRKLDNSNGYESWTDNYDLAKAYGDNVYYIDIPTSEIKNDIIDNDSKSETYGDRNLIYFNDKPVGIKGKSGKEYMLYTDHDNYSDIEYKKVEEADKASFSINPTGTKKTAKVQESNLLNEIAPIDDKKLETVEEKETTASILTKSPKRPAKDLLKQSADAFMRKLVDAGNTINTVGKLTGDKHLYEYFNNTKQARQSAEYMIGEAQTDIQGNRVGNSLIRIFEEVRAKGDSYTNDFFEYLLHMHNIDRMAQNKPVFGASVTADDSRRIADALLEKHPEFEKQANKVYAYNRNLMQWRVDSGLISKEQADLMNEMYPHYVPTFRDVSGTSGSRAMQGTVQIANTVRKAKGSNKDIMPIDASMARQTMQTVQAAKRNLLGNRLLNDALNNKDKVGEYIQAVEKTTDKADLETELDTPKDTNLDSNNNVFKIFRNGETYVMQVNNGIYEGLKSISSEIDNTDTNLILNRVKAANNMFKKLITGYSPMFTIKNFARDIQDSGLYSKELREFIKKYPNTYKEMISNGKMWQLYKSLGGTGSSFFDYETGIEKTLDTKNKTSTKIKEATIGKVEELNMMIEQAPRFAEFMATIEKAGNQNYDTLMEAMLNAADITVNFGRSGTWGKALNETAVPFFNPSIQGFDKFARTVLESRDGKKFAKLAIRATLLGILPSVINELLYWDDEEYENLTDRDKDTNFLIKTGDNKWLKIPKGRVLSIFGNTAVRGLRTLKGEEWDVGEFFKNQASQTAPISVLESNIASPIQAVKNNKTWYGSDIVPQRLQDYAPKDQYDENTDAFSKWLGGKINYSPKKINYLIDAYTGIIGDVVLPLTTPKAETNPFTKAFVVDGVTSNEISNDFYNMLDKYNPKQNPKKSAKEVSRYLNKQSSQVSDIYKQIREVENSDISDDEKRKQVRELRELANTIELTAMATAPEYEKAVEKYRGTFADEDVDSDYAYLFANRDIFGAEYAVKTFSKSLYNNHKNENMDKFFRSYFTKQYFQKKLEPEKTKTTAKNTLPTLKQQRAKLPSMKK